MEQTEENPIGESPTEIKKTIFSYIDPRTNISGFFILLFSIIVLGAASIGVTSKSFEKPKGNSQSFLNPSSLPIPISSYTLVYGIWTGNSSVVKAYDMAKGKEFILAELPNNIKKVTVLSPTELLYINNTDDKDYGREIAIYNIQNNTKKVVAYAAPGFSVDDYVVSPNKQYLTTWEVAFSSGSAVLRNGSSRVYSLDLQKPTQKYLIYDESASQPVHYPRAITNSGEIYLDTFLPNSGAGWAYGMSVSDFTGSTKQDLKNMQNGTYGTQPVLSPNGRYLAFAGYDGSNGPGTDAKTVNGKTSRQAILIPNTIDLLDTQTKTRIKLPNISNQNIYSFIFWDKEGRSLVFTRLLLNDKKNEVVSTEFYYYDLSSQTPKRIENLGYPQNTFVSFVSPQMLLVGKESYSLSTLGNLGISYAYFLTNASTLDIATSRLSPIGLKDGLIQFIGITPSSYFAGGEKPSSTQRQQLQLETFVFKPNLAPKRLKQQSSDLPYTETLPPIADFGGCTGTTNEFGLAVCFGSPLYLYGPEGMRVNVKILTDIYSPSPPYPPNGYNVVLSPNGKMDISGNTYESIEYKYTPATQDITPPPYGTVASEENLSEVLSYYGKSLGLNEKETNDLTEYAKEKMTSPYIFVSFFDKKTSKQILPISFDPQPNTYINIVFYFRSLKDKPATFPPMPTFAQIPKRGNFTVVEVSSIVEDK